MEAKNYLEKITPEWLSVENVLITTDMSPHWGSRSCCACLLLISRPPGAWEKSKWVLRRVNKNEEFSATGKKARWRSKNSSVGASYQ